MTATVVNSVMLFAFVICLLFTIGDVDQVTSNTLPLIEVYYQATNSKPATNFLVLMPTIIILFALFNAFASVSRLIWAFAKDKGMPFSKTFAYVSISPTYVNTCDGFLIR
jgi:choline transport protein